VAEKLDEISDELDTWKLVLALGEDELPLAWSFPPAR